MMELEPNIFQVGVLDALVNGENGHLDWPVEPGEDFENSPGNNVRAFIITPYGDGPRSSDSSDLRYPDQVNRIKKLLNNVLGRTDTAVIPYLKRIGRELFKTPFGKVLIQYDPEAGTRDPGAVDCDSQLAGVELWFEDHPVPRYSDRWIPISDQHMHPISKRSNVNVKDDADTLRQRAMTGANDSDDAGSCPARSKRISASSATQSATTLKTSFTSLSSKEDITRSSEAHSSKTEPLSPSNTPTKALSIKLDFRADIFTNIDKLVWNKLFWSFFTTDYGKAVGCRDDSIKTEMRNFDRSNRTPLWPGGTFSLKLSGQECEYKNSGNNAGKLFCGGRAIDCFVDAPRQDSSRDFYRCGVNWRTSVVICPY